METTPHTRLENALKKLTKTLGVGEVSSNAASVQVANENVTHRFVIKMNDSKSVRAMCGLLEHIAEGFHL